MSDFTLSGREFFDALPQPVLLCGSAIEYCNGAARALFAAERLGPGSSLPLGLPGPERAPCVTTLETNRGIWSVELRRLESGVLYLLTPCPEENGEALNQMNSLSTQMRLILARTVMSMDLLQSQLSELERERSADQVACVNRNLYQLLRLSDHLNLCTRTRKELLTLFPPVTLDLNAFCEELCQSLEPMLSSLSRTLRCELSGEVLQVDAHRDLLMRLLCNLCANAVAADGNLCLSLCRRGDRALLTLADDGRGVPPELLSTVFTPTGTDKNLSIGLALCMRIAAVYDGQIMLSPQKQGTIVSLSLPLHKDDPNASPRFRQPLGAMSGYSLLLSEMSPCLGERFYHMDELS